MASLDIHALRKLLAAMEAEEAAKKSTNNGTVGSFNNYGGGRQNYSGAEINSGANSGNRDNRHTYDNHGGGSSINNSGTVSGNGNGSNVGGNFDASTRTCRS